MATKIMTAVGNAQISTAQSKFGGASGLFDGNGDYVSTPDNVAWDFTAHDGTIDFWVRLTSLASGAARHFVGQFDGTGNQWTTYHYITSEVAVGITAVNEISTAASILATNTWHHIAYVRSGATTFIFIDGVEKASATTVVWNNSANLLFIGGFSAANTGIIGNMDELRISDIARWTAGFTPPTSAYTTDANTTLLLHFDGTNGSTTFTDDSVAAVASNFLLMGV